MGEIIDFQKELEKRGEVPTNPTQTVGEPKIIGFEQAKIDMEREAWEKRKAEMLANWDYLTHDEQRKFEYEMEVWEQTHRPLTPEEEFYLNNQPSRKK